tara:strand:- start:31367 stop:32038 length:672 start_codon:yes stop_codon:yes gene_type:complete
MKTLKDIKMKYDKIYNNTQLTDPSDHFTDSFPLDLENVYFSEETIDILDHGEATRKHFKVPFNFFFCYEANYNIVLVNLKTDQTLEKSAIYCDTNLKLLNTFDHIQEDIVSFQHQCKNKYGRIIEDDDFAILFKIKLLKSPYILETRGDKHYLFSIPYNTTFRKFDSFSKDSNGMVTVKDFNNATVKEECIEELKLPVQKNGKVEWSKKDVLDHFRVILNTNL